MGFTSHMCMDTNVTQGGKCYRMAHAHQAGVANDMAVFWCVLVCEIPKIWVLHFIAMSW